MNNFEFTKIGRILDISKIEILENKQSKISIFVSSSSGYYDKNNQWINKNETCNFTIFGKLAESAHKTLYVGRQVVLRGSISNNKYVTNGVEVNSFNFVVNEYTALGSKKKS